MPINRRVTLKLIRPPHLPPPKRCRSPAGRFFPGDPPQFHLNSQAAGHRSRARHCSRAAPYDRPVAGVLLREGVGVLLLALPRIPHESFAVHQRKPVVNHPHHGFHVLAQRDQDGQVSVMEAAKRKRVTAIIHVELAAIVITVLCAAIMARGGWV